MKEIKMVIREQEIEKQVKMFGNKVESYTIEDLNNSLCTDAKLVTITLKF